MDDRVDPPRRAPWHLWLVGILGLLFDGVGALDYFMTQTRNDAYLSRFAPDQLAVLYGLPAWLVAFWALAVWGGVLGAILLLARRRLAVPVLLVSMVSMAATAIHDFVSPNGLYGTAGSGPGFVLVIFGVAFGLWLYAWSAGRRGVLA